MAAPEADFPIPAVHTSVTVQELRLLQRYAHEAGTVLEIGTHYGFTCIGMALAGAHVTSVDPHFEGPANNPDTWEPFLANMTRHQISHRYRRDAFNETQHNALYDRGGFVTAYRQAIEEWEVTDGYGNRATYGLVFIDGNHTWPCPMRDARIALAHLRAPGYVAFHDVTPHWPGVWRTVHELTEAGELVKVEQVQTMGVYQAREHVAVPPTP